MERSLPDPHPVAWNHRQSVIEVFRHALYRTGLYRALYFARRQAGLITDHLAAADRRARFEAIYKLGVWKYNGGQEALSGAGSELAATVPLRSALAGLLSELGIERFVDVGCGDWTWMSKVDLPCRYLGVDIVGSVIALNNTRYARDGVAFQKLDAVSEELPSCDAALCREVIFHLSFAEGQRLLDNMIRSADWVILTTDRSIWFNSDIRTGDFRRLNLERSPFRLPPPDRVLADDGREPGRICGVWNTAKLRKRRHVVALDREAAEVRGN